MGIFQLKEGWWTDMDIIARGMAASSSNTSIGPPTNNTYTLTQGQNFEIETTDDTAKTIVFDIPKTDSSISNITIKLKYTVAAAITFPVGVVWKDGIIPTFAVGGTYLLLFTSYDGETWLASSIGRW